MFTVENNYYIISKDEGTDFYSLTLLDMFRGGDE
jgi:hypothetical protein